VACERVKPTYQYRPVRPVGQFRSQHPTRADIYISFFSNSPSNIRYRNIGMSLRPPASR